MLHLRFEPARRVVLDRAEEALGRVEREGLRPVPGGNGLVVPLHEVVEGVQRELVRDDALQPAGEALGQHRGVGEEHRMQNADLIVGQQDVARPRRLRQVVEIIFERLAIFRPRIVAPIVQRLQKPLAAFAAGLQRPPMVPLAGEVRIKRQVLRPGDGCDAQRRSPAKDKGRIEARQRLRKLNRPRSLGRLRQVRLDPGVRGRRAILPLLLADAGEDGLVFLAPRDRLAGAPRTSRSRRPNPAPSAGLLAAWPSDPSPSSAGPATRQPILQRGSAVAGGTFASARTSAQRAAA